MDCSPGCSLIHNGSLIINNVSLSLITGQLLINWVSVYYPQYINHYPQWITRYQQGINHHPQWITCHWQQIICHTPCISHHPYCIIYNKLVTIHNTSIIIHSWSVIIHSLMYKSSTMHISSSTMYQRSSTMDHSNSTRRATHIAGRTHINHHILLIMHWYHISKENRFSTQTLTTVFSHVCLSKNITKAIPRHCEWRANIVITIIIKPKIKNRTKPKNPCWKSLIMKHLSVCKAIIILLLYYFCNFFVESRPTYLFHPPSPSSVPSLSTPRYGERVMIVEDT